MPRCSTESRSHLFRCQAGIGGLRRGSLQRLFPVLQTVNVSNLIQGPRTDLLLLLHEMRPCNLSRHFSPRCLPVPLMINIGMYNVFKYCSDTFQSIDWYAIPSETSEYYYSAASLRSWCERVSGRAVPTTDADHVISLVSSLELYFESVIHVEND